MPLSITPNDLFDVAGAIRVGIRADAIREAFLWQGYSPTEPFDASGRVTFHVGEVARKLATAARKTAATDMTEDGVDSFIAAAQLLKSLYVDQRRERDNAASRAAYAGRAYMIMYEHHVEHIHADTLADMKARAVAVTDQRCADGWQLVGGTTGRRNGEGHSVSIRFQRRVQE